MSSTNIAQSLSQREAHRVARSLLRMAAKFALHAGWSEVDFLRWSDHAQASIRVGIADHLAAAEARRTIQAGDLDRLEAARRETSREETRCLAAPEAVREDQPDSPISLTPGAQR